MADAGWYPDAMAQGWEAYFDGQRWTGHRRPVAGQAPPGPQDPRSQQDRQQGWPPAHQQWTSEQTPQTQRNPQQAEPTQWQAQQAEQTQWQAPQQQWPADQTQRIDRTTVPPYGGWQQPQWDEPRARRRNRKPLIISAAVVVVLVAAGLISWLVWPDDAPTLTYHGKQVAAAGGTLSTAERSVKSVVAKRHGTSSGDTRCYYAQATRPPKGQRKSDVEQNLRCGPVLFVDGDTSREYVSVPLTGKPSGSKIALTASSSLEDVQPQAVSKEITLFRPDGKKAPSGVGGLHVPSPPPAAPTVLTVAELGPTQGPKSLGSGSVVVGRGTKMEVTAAGYIDRYGQGDDARSAPSGKKLMAFKVDYAEGDLDASTTARGRLVFPGQAARQVPEANPTEWVIAAVPASGVQLQLVDGGYTQTLSLPDGKPGANNLAVLRRVHRTAVLSRSFAVPVKLSARGGGSGNTTISARASIAELDFWAAANTSVHARTPQNALLTLNVTFRDSGKTYGFDPELLQLRLPGGQRVSARNVGTGGKLSTVFEVPASFTTGVLTVTGSEKVGSLRLSVRKPYSFTVSIPAG